MYNNKEYVDVKKKEEYVKKVLLMPIKSVTRRQKYEINVSEKFILSGQKYKSKLDPDMSCFAVGFYKTLYNDVSYFDDSNGKFDEEFMGDTMITNYKNLDIYHSLANFWCLPMKVGRTFGSYSKASKCRDRMDVFLKFLREDNNYSNYANEFKRYFRFFNDYNMFIEKHFLSDCYIKNNSIIEIDSSEVAKTIIEERANKIAKKCTEELFTYFNEDCKITVS